MAANKMQALRKSIGRNSRESMGESRLKKAAAAEGSAPPPAPPAIPESSARLIGLSRMPEAALIPIDRIEPDEDQPREEFDHDELLRLSDSILERGQLQPIRVRWSEERKRYIVVFGERRLRASRLAGLEMVKCLIQDGPVDPDELLVDQLVENCVRQDLRPIEQAKAFRRLMETKGWKGKEVGEALRVSPASVSRALSLLELPDVLQSMIDSGELAPATAYELSKVPDPKAQLDLAGKVASGGMTRSEVAEEIRRSKGDRAALRSPSEFHGEISGGPVAPVAPVASKALPDWRDRPAMGLGLDKQLVKLLADCEIDTAGEAWGLLEAGVLMDQFQWSWLEVKSLERALVLVRQVAGDPDPFLQPMPPSAPPQPWESRRLADERSLFSEARKAAEALGISTFGQLHAKFKEGTNDQTFGGYGGLLWSTLNRVKGIAQTVYKPVETDAVKRTCRECGCTDDDCRQCIEKAGRPCHWVEDDLCSACTLPPKPQEGEVSDAELRRAIGLFEGHESRWAKAAKTGLSDADLFAMIGKEIGLEGSTPGFWSDRQIGYKGEKDPAIFIPDYPRSKRPTLYGAKLRDRVRALLSIPYPEAGAPGRPAAGSSPAKLVDILPDLEWRKSQFRSTDEVFVAEVDGIEVVFRSDLGERSDVELLAAAREAVAFLEARLGAKHR